MNKLLLSILISIIFFVICNDKVKANHLIGADLTYKCVGKDSFLVKLTIYRDCRGAQFNDSSLLKVISTCNTFNIYVYRNEIIDITPVCASSCTRCDGPCAFPYGYEKHVYSGLVVLPQNSCCEFTVSYQQCCRDSPFLDPWLFYTEAKLNRCVEPCNSSPFFANEPVSIICRGQDFVFNQGLVETDGDSIVFLLTEALKSSTESITYLSPYSYLEPLKYLGMNSGMRTAPFPFGFHLDTVKGTLMFRPTEVQSREVVILVKVYRNNTLISEIRRDMRFVVIDCPNNNPPVIDPPFSFQACANTEIVIPVSIWDPDSTGSDPDSVFLNWNKGIPGASFEADPAPIRTTGFFKWTPTEDDVRSQPHRFTAIGHDNKCPLQAYTSRSFDITVKLPMANISYEMYETADCGRVDFSADMITNSDSDLSIEWIGAGGMHSYEIAHSHYYPGSGKYPFTLTLIADSCVNIYHDTIEIPDFPTVSVANNELIKCDGDTLEFEAVTSGGAGQIKYLWSTGDTNQLISRKMLFIPDTIFIDSVNYELSNVRSKTIIVQVEDENACVNYDTVFIKIRQLPEPGLDSLITLCAGVLFEADAGFPEYFHEWFEISDPENILSRDPVFSIGDSGTYIVRVIDSSIMQCTNYDTIRINVNPVAETPVISGPEVLCEGDSAIYTIDNYEQGLEYFWMCTNQVECFTVNSSMANVKFSGSGNFSFDVFANSPKGCGTESYTFDVLVNPVPEVPVIIGDTLVCAGDSVLYSIDNFDPAFNYSWNCSGPANCDNAEGNSAWINFIEITNNAFIEVIVSSPEACGTESYTKEIIVAPVTEEPIIIGDTEVCEGDSVFYFIDNYDPVFNYTWNCSGSANCNNAEGNSAWIYFEGHNNSFVEVVVNSSNGCGTESYKKEVIVNPLTEEPVIISETEICVGDSLLITIDNYNPEFEYLWTCSGSVICNDAFGPSALLLFTGTDSAYLEIKVSSPKGCGDEIIFGKSFVPFTLPEKPLIEGVNQLIEGSVENYVIINSQIGIDYNWNCFGSANCNGGAGEEMEINFVSACEDAIIEVTANNICGSNTTSKAVIIEPESSEESISSIISAVVFPNPGEENFTLRLRTKAIEVLNIELYNALGKIIYKNQHRNLFCDTDIDISLEGLASGTYLLILKNEEGEMLRKLVVK